jgi:hypothetical protein
MEKTIEKRALPRISSVQTLAEFWDTNDLADFSSELEEVSEPLFVRAKGASLSFRLGPSEAIQLRKVARSKGVAEAEILREWILDRLRESSAGQRRR